jgi:hypothetical protein
VGIALDTLQMRIDASILAHDSMKGRATGSAGEAMAAAYIEERLRSMGLDAVGPSFGQTVPLVSFRVDSTSTVSLRHGPETTTFVHGRDFLVDRGGRDAFAGFGGDVVFLGLPEHAEASAASVDLRGSVVVVIGMLGTDALELTPDWVARGVTGIIQIVQDTTLFADIRTGLGTDRLAIDAPVDDALWQSQLPRLIAGRRLTSAMFEGAPLPPAVFRSEPFRAVSLDVTVRLDLHFDTTRIAATNVAAVLPGADPALATTFVAFTAHFDHLGISEADDSGDSVYNGFTDNAAGVAMLLAIADALRDEPPARSLLFLFFTGEEHGLLGSTWFVTEPPFALESIAALINLDGGAPPRPPVSWRLAGGLGTAFGELAARIVTAAGWEPSLTTASPNSDHWPFLRLGIPSVFLIPGPAWEGTSEAARDSLRLRWDHYHQPADAWSPDYPFTGIARYAELAARIGLAVANPRPEGTHGTSFPAGST